MAISMRFARLASVLLALAVAYAFAVWQPVRAIYSPVDKLAHALVFALVFFALAWALRGVSGWRLALLAAALGGAVELQQMWVPRFTASWEDWFADLAGIGAAWAVFGAVGQVRAAMGARAEAALAPGRLPEAQFWAALEALPLVSVDWVLSNPAGEILVGQRLNAPARDTWFTPGGRIRKGEALRAAMRRVACEELGAPIPLAEAMVQRAAAMGAWDHFYPDSAFSPTVPTHYVNLPFAATLSAAEVESLRLPVGEQHGHWRWISLAQAAQEVHAHVQPYVEWLRSRAASPASSSFSSTRLAGSEITL